MRINNVRFLVLLLLASLASTAQVVSPAEIKDPALRDLQTRYMEDLKLIGRNIVQTNFEYPFYISRKLDLDEKQQQTADQRSIRFEHFNGKTVLAITGNYYAAYSADKLSAEQRARETFLKVVFPVLKIAVPHFQNNRAVQGYALEISHHILGKVMNVPMERPENLVVFFPQNAAIKLLAAKDETAQQAALLEGQVLLNAAPVSIWLTGEAPQVAANNQLVESPDPAPDTPSQMGAEIMSSSDGHSGGAVSM